MPCPVSFPVSVVDREELNVKRNLLASTVVAAVTTGTLLVSVGVAGAHGFITSDESGMKTGGELIARAAMKENKDIGAIVYEPQSIEGKGDKGREPLSGLQDGKIASAGVARASKLDEQNVDRWKKQKVKTGDVKVNWFYTAPHRTEYYRYYITKQGWNPNKPLQKKDFELMTEIQSGGATPRLGADNPAHTINIPQDRSGYHVILAQWEINDTSNAFYNVMDVNVTGKGGTAERPDTPTGARTSEVTRSSVKLSWKKSAGAATYDIYRNGKKIASTADTEFTDTKLSPSTSYTYEVAALNASGEASKKSQPITVRTAERGEKDEVAAPTELSPCPGHLTHDNVRLLWNESPDADVTEYEVFRDGEFLGRTSGAHFDDKSVTPGAEYRYKVRAVNTEGYRSAFTKEIRVVVPEKNTSEWPEWSPTGAYKKGDRVTHDGVVYKCLQDYTGNGDPNWIFAPSLWAEAE